MEQSDTMEVQINHHDLINLYHQIGIMLHQEQQPHHMEEEHLQVAAIRKHHQAEVHLIVLPGQNPQHRLQQRKAILQVVLLRQDKVSHLVILVEEAE
jgi:hypothetical protein